MNKWLSCSIILYLYGTVTSAELVNVSFKPGLIESQCSSKLLENTSVSDLGDSLKKLQQEYSTTRSRTEQPEAFVASIDAAISKSKFAPLLECRNHLAKTPGFSYQLVFQDPSHGDLSMQVRQEKGKVVSGNSITNVILYFNLIKTVERVIFVYLHELTHVCQAIDSTNIYNEYEASKKLFSKDELKAIPPEGPTKKSLDGNLDTRYSQLDLALKKAFQNNFLNEIKAFYIMQLAYTEFVKASPNLCTNSFESKELAESYMASERRLIDGIFAQAIIHHYMRSYSSKEEYLLVPDSKPIHYNRLDFSMKSLNPDFKQAIKNIGIQVTESEESK